MESLLWGRLVSFSELSRSCDQVDLLIEKAERFEMVCGDRCTRCNHQTDFEMIGERRYCTHCLTLGRMISGDYLYHLPDPQVKVTRSTKMTWSGTLSPEQARASIEMIETLTDTSKPHMIHAVTGAGKTEMIFPVIESVLTRGGRIGLASPRVDVCVELYPRIQAAFSNTEVILLHGKAEESYRYTPIVVCTTHQLLRFKEAFDVLIVDEVDAFPYVNDDALHFAVKRATKLNGKLIYLTATPDETLMELVHSNQLSLTTLPARYHRHRLPEPTFEWIGNWRTAIRQQKRSSRLWRLFHQFRTLPGVKLFFMPSIRYATSFYDWIIKDEPMLREEIACVHAKDVDRQLKIQQLRDGKLDTLITTTILERGVTFTHCHVCIIGAEDQMFRESALVQMSGRVGRRPNYPGGVLVYAHFGVSRAMKSAKTQIQTMNQLAKEKGLIDG